MSQDPDASPVHPLPPLVTALALVLTGIEVALSAAARGFIGGADGIGWRQAAIERYGFFGQVFDLMLERGSWPLEHVARFVTYPFVHYGFTHALFVIVFLLALGKMVAERMGPGAMLTLFFGSAFSGALVYGLALDDPLPLAGGFPAVYGLIGGFTYILWVSLGAVGAPQWRAFTLIGFLLGIQLVFGVLFGGTNEWVAEVSGFATGFALSFLVGPGGWRRAVQALRRR
ncbi:rhomboid family intramembrane serine protease [Roseitranquillus sediminis]|uniref:rhomboid family intramembrane serine protease n=1 Tax=Roseitranquillus sediminis TaxID=2809051 RepID=UPI001D0CD5EA|nr:rhomboid family intramembrane serine protease [Roseitranquillus sediminis]MBM9595270.1 rhomboid family intramembrane serine protease [Roseitranquillus sediminis]